MRIVFIGLVSIGWHCLKALLECGANVVEIVTADKKEMIKKSHMDGDYYSEFGGLANTYNVSLSTVRDVSVPLDVRHIKQLKPDIIFCIGWPQIVRGEILDVPRYGCIATHPTLLPERRGGAPINWCLIDGLTKSGVTLFYMSRGVDSGDIIAQKEYEIAFSETAGIVLNKVTDVAVGLIKENYPLLEKGTAPRITQDDSKATYTRRRRPEDGLINWNCTSLSVYNLIRAVTLPFPGAYTYCKGEKVIVWDSELLTGYKPRFDVRPGEVIDSIEEKGIVVATGDSCVLVKSVEAGNRTLRGEDIISSLKITPGTILGEGKYGKSVDNCASS